MTNNHLQKDGDQLYREVRRTYSIALIVIAMSAVAAFATIGLMMTFKAQYAKLINVSGRQRMLSQRIALLTSQYVQNTENTETLKLLVESKDLFEQSHRALIVGSSELDINPLLSPPVKEVFFGEKDLDGNVNLFVDQVNLMLELEGIPEKQRSVAERIQETAKSNLLVDLDRVVKLLELESNASDAFLLKIEFGLLLFLLLGILCEARYIFEPMAEMVSRTTEELSASSKKMKWAADHDALTGLANRRKLSEEIEKGVKLANACGTQVAVLHLDLDKFKAVNDTFGHAAGDEILTSVARKLEACIRKDDMAARIGGDEFVVLLKDVNEHVDLSRLSERIISDICEPIQYENQMCSVGCSIGISLSRPGETQPERLLLDADIALNEAKNLGRGRFEFVTHDLTDKFRSMERLKADILLGLEKEEFVPFFQPQICGKTGAVAGVETLARWTDGRGGYKEAASFIPVAEELNLLEKIDRAVIKQGMRTFVQWKKDGYNIPRIAFNLSMAKLKDKGFISWMEARIEEFGLQPSEIALEILESVMLDGNSDQIVTNINLLGQKGFHIELDDFGSGHASINTLLELSVNRIKVDRSLVANVCDDANARVLFEAVVRLADKLDIETLVEGIESQEQVDLLHQLNENFVYQGFFFARPMPGNDLLKWLRKREFTSTSSGRSSDDVALNRQRWPTQWAVESAN